MLTLYVTRERGGEYTHTHTHTVFIVLLSYNIAALIILLWSSVVSKWGYIACMLEEERVPPDRRGAKLEKKKKKTGQEGTNE